MDNNINDAMESPKASKLMIRMVIIAALVIIVIGIVVYRSFAALPFALGVMTTAGLNIMKLRMLTRTVQKVVHMDDQDAGKNVIRLQYLLRYFLTGAVLVAVGLIQNYTTPPPIFSTRESYFAVWAALFQFLNTNGPESLMSAPLISLWGALAGIFTMQISVILVRSMKLEKDGDNFIEYKDDEEENSNDTDENSDDEDKNNDDASKNNDDGSENSDDTSENSDETYEDEADKTISD